MKKRTLKAEEITKRAESLLAVLELVHGNKDKSITQSELVKLMEDMPRSKHVLSELFKSSILTKGKKVPNKEIVVKYTGIEPVFIVAKKIIVSVIEQGRNWNDKQKTVGSRSGKQPAAIVVNAEPIDKMVPLHYNNFLKEIKDLKERYRLTVPNAHIEVIVKVSSTMSV